MTLKCGLRVVVTLQALASCCQNHALAGRVDFAEAVDGFVSLELACKVLNILAVAFDGQMNSLVIVGETANDAVAQQVRALADAMRRLFMR